MSSIQTLQRGGWHRPVSLRSLLLVGGLVLMIWLMLMLAAVWFVYTQLDARMALQDQPVTLRLPAGLQAQAVVEHPVRTRVDVRPRVSVPVHQTLQAQVDDVLLLRAGFDAVLPVTTTVKVDQVVPVKTELSMQVPLVGWLPPFDVTLPVTLDVPFKAEVPVNVRVPIHFDALVSGELRGPIAAPIDTVFHLRPQVHGEVNARLRGQMDFVVQDAMPPLHLTIERARLFMPFDVPSIRQRQRP